MHGAVIRGIVKLGKLIGCNLDMFINKSLECFIRVFDSQTTEFLHMSIFAKRGLIHAVSRYTFHRHLTNSPIDQQHICLILLKTDQSAFTQISFSSLSDVHECSGGLQMASSYLYKKTASCNSPNDWLMSLSMDLVALCDMWRLKWHQWMPFGCF